MLRCRQVGPYSVLAAAPAYLCSGPVYAPYRIAAVVLAVVWVAGLAVAIALLLLWLRFTDSLSKTPAVSRFGVLYEAYRPGCFWWEAVVMARRTLLTALTLIEDTATSFVFLTAACVAIAVLQTYVQPFRQQIENSVDYFSLALLVMVAVINLFAVVSSGYAAEAAIYTADVLAGAGAFFLLLFALYMSRGSIVAAVAALRKRITNVGGAVLQGVKEEKAPLEVALLGPKGDDNDGV